METTDYQIVEIQGISGFRKLPLFKKNKKAGIANFTTKKEFAKNKKRFNKLQFTDEQKAQLKAAATKEERAALLKSFFAAAQPVAVSTAITVPAPAVDAATPAAAVSGTVYIEGLGEVEFEYVQGLNGKLFKKLKKGISKIATKTTPKFMRKALNKITPEKLRVLNTGSNAAVQPQPAVYQEFDVKPAETNAEGDTVYVEGIGEVPVGSIFTDVVDKVKSAVTTIFPPATSTTTTAPTVDMQNNTAANPTATDTTTATEQTFFQKYKMPILIGGGVLVLGTAAYFIFKPSKKEG